VVLGWAFGGGVVGPGVGAAMTAALLDVVVAEGFGGEGG
jgi:hypothetical protein